ncbi:MAG: hypothetical protein AAGJ28_11535 [Pseudomonadota bacterium]
MTAIMDEMRRLDAARDRGELSAVDHAARKAALIEAIPDAETGPPMAQTIGVWHMIILSFSLVGFVSGAALMISGDVTLALTLGITVLASVTIGLFRMIDE